MLTVRSSEEVETKATALSVSPYDRQTIVAYMCDYLRFMHVKRFIDTFIEVAGA